MKGSINSIDFHILLQKLYENANEMLTQQKIKKILQEVSKGNKLSV